MSHWRAGLSIVCKAFILPRCGFCDSFCPPALSFDKSHDFTQLSPSCAKAVRARQSGTPAFPPKMEPGAQSTPALSALPCCTLAELQPSPVPSLEDWVASDAWLERAVYNAVGHGRGRRAARSRSFLKRGTFHTATRRTEAPDVLCPYRICTRLAEAAG